MEAELFGNCEIADLGAYRGNMEDCDREKQEKGGGEMNGWLVWLIGYLFTLGVISSSAYEGALSNSTSWDYFALFLAWPCFLGEHFA